MMHKTLDFCIFIPPSRPSPKGEGEAANAFPGGNGKGG